MHHGVRIPTRAGRAATLSDRYITDRFLPDKAIDLVDEAASRLRIGSTPCRRARRDRPPQSISSRSSEARSKEKDERPPRSPEPSRETAELEEEPTP